MNYYLDDYDLRDDQNSTRHKKTLDDDDMPPLEPFDQPPDDFDASENSFFGFIFTKKTDMRKFMMERLTIEEINAELVELGEEEQPTKTKAIAEMLKNINQYQK